MNISDICSSQLFISKAKVKRVLEDYNPCSEQEEKDKEAALKCFDVFEDILTRNNKIAHVTSSGFVINMDKDKTLMVYHNIFNSWSWTGGHADGEEDLLSVAIRKKRV